MKEPKIGECFEIDGYWYRTVKGDECDKCMFYDDIKCHRMYCNRIARKDGKGVYFVRATQFDVNIERAQSIITWVNSLSYLGRIDFYKKLNQKLKDRDKKVK